MDIDDINTLCAEIAYDEAEKRAEEYANDLEEQEVKKLDRDAEFYGIVGSCEGCYDYQDA